MRTEIKTKQDSGEDKKGVEGETHFFAWKMKLPEDFKGSNKFTHLHQIKPVGGEHAGMPTITLTANGEKLDLEGKQYARPELRLRYAGLSKSQVTVETIDLGLLKGKWIQFVEKVHYGESDKGRYELLVYDPINGSIDNPIYAFESYSLQTWKVGVTDDDDDEEEEEEEEEENADDEISDIFSRPKWGIYRSNVEEEKLGDEIVGFNDFIILEVTDFNDGLYGDIKSFAEYAEKVSGDVATQDEIPVQLEDAEILYVHLDNTTAGTGTLEDPFNTIGSAIAYINSDPTNNEKEYQISLSGILTAPEELTINEERSETIAFVTADPNYFEIIDAEGALIPKAADELINESGEIINVSVMHISFDPGEAKNPYTIYSTSEEDNTSTNCLPTIANPTVLGYLDDDPLITTAVTLSSGLPYDSECPLPGISDRIRENTPQPVQVMITGDQVGSSLFILPESNEQAPDTKYGWETYFYEGFQANIDNVLVYRLLIRETDQLIQFIPAGSVIWIGNGEDDTEETVTSIPSAAAKFTVSPNPSSSEVMLDIDHQSGDVEYAMYTINGILVNSGAIQQETASPYSKPETNKMNKVIDVADLASGMYIIKITYDDGTIVNSKFIKN